MGICNISMVTELTCHLECAVVLSDVGKEVLGVSVISIEQLLQVVWMLRMVDDRVFSVATTERWCLSNKLETVASGTPAIHGAEIGRARERVGIVE